MLIDVVGYSKLLVNEQVELLQELNRIVRSTDRFRAAELNFFANFVPSFPENESKSYASEPEISSW